VSGDLVNAFELRELIDSAMNRSKILNIIMYLFDWKFIFQLEYVDSEGRKFKYVFPKSISLVNDLPTFKDMRLMASSRVTLSLGEALVYNVIHVRGKQIWGVYKARISSGGSGIKRFKNKLLSWGFVPKNWTKHYNTSPLRIRVSLILPVDIKRFIEFYRYLPSPRGASKELFNRVVDYLRDSKRKIYPIIVTPRPPIKLSGVALFRYLAYNSPINNPDLYFGGYKTQDITFVTSPDLYFGGVGASESVVVGREPLIGSYMDVKDGSFVCNLMI